MSAITKDTTVSVSIVLLLIGGLLAGTSWATRMSANQEALQVEVQQLRGDLNAAVTDRWRGSDMALWVHQANREAEIWAERRSIASDEEVTPLILPDPTYIRNTQ